MIKIEFDPANLPVAKALGRALLEIAGVSATGIPVEDIEVRVGGVKVEPVQAEYGDAASLFDKPQSGENEEAETQGQSTGQVDCNGVEGNDAFCSGGKTPFYTSGPKEGQWKKKRGVPEEDFDAWYASELAALTEAAQGVADEPSANAASAFAAPEQTNAAGAFAAQQQQQPASSPAPKDCGEWFGWVSAQQANGKLTEQQVGDAYIQAGIGVSDLFPPNTEQTVAANIAKLYATLEPITRGA